MSEVLKHVGQILLIIFKYIIVHIDLILMYVSSAVLWNLFYIRSDFCPTKHLKTFYLTTKTKDDLCC